MKKSHLLLAAAGMVILGSGLLYAGSLRPVTILVDGEAQIVESRAFTGAQILYEAGISLGSGDQISPDPDAFIGWNGPVVIERASQVQVWNGDQSLSPPTLTMDQTAGNILMESGMQLFPGDALFLDGAPIDADAELLPGEAYVLQVLPALPITLDADSRSETIYSSHSTVSGALWSEGVRVSSVDSLSIAAGEGFEEDANVALERPAPYRFKLASARSRSPHRLNESVMCWLKLAFPCKIWITACLLKMSLYPMTAPSAWYVCTRK
jgi:resuscitation-promoting factor RpfB